MSTEQWKDVVGYEGLYQVSNFQRERARIFDVSPSTIQNIDDNRTWSHIDVK